mgnify:FL=1
MRAKTGVKLAYKQSAPCGYAFAPIFTSDEYPMILDRPLAGQEDKPSGTVTDTQWIKSPGANCSPGFL